MDTALLQQFLLCHISYTVLAPFFPFPSNKHRMPFHSHCNCSHQYDLASNLQCILVSIARIFFFPFEAHSWGCGKSRNSGADFVSLRGLCPAKIQCQQLRPALTFWEGREHLEVWIFPGNGAWVMQSHTEIFLSMFHEERLESSIELPQKELGAEIPSPTWLLTWQLQDVPASVLKCLQELGAGDVWVSLSELIQPSPAQEPWELPWPWAGMCTALKSILEEKKSISIFCCQLPLCSSQGGVLTPCRNLVFNVKLCK